MVCRSLRSPLPSGAGNRTCRGTRWCHLSARTRRPHPEAGRWAVWGARLLADGSPWHSSAAAGLASLHEVAGPGTRRRQKRASDDFDGITMPAFPSNSGCLSRFKTSLTRGTRPLNQTLSIQTSFEMQLHTQLAQHLLAFFFFLSSPLMYQLCSLYKLSAVYLNAIAQLLKRRGTS